METRFLPFRIEAAIFLSPLFQRKMLGINADVRGVAGGSKLADSSAERMEGGGGGAMGGGAAVFLYPEII